MTFVCRCLSICVPLSILFISFIYHSLLHSLTHSLTHSHIHSLTYSFIHSFNRSLMHSFIHSLTHAFTVSGMTNGVVLSSDPPQEYSRYVDVSNTFLSLTRSSLWSILNYSNVSLGAKFCSTICNSIVIISALPFAIQ